ncbi:signal peptidase I [candidate division KSB1 bacterium]|nr:signal peptidase I [candidate division KSB1 bacterium]
MSSHSLKHEKTNTAISEMLQEQLTNNKNAAFRVISNSMEPFIHVGDRVVIEAANTTQLTSGDIILYFNGHRFCTHRFVQTLKKDNKIRIITKGDNLPGFDLPFEKEKYLGRVITIVRNDKNIELHKTRYRLVNKMLGKLLTLHWLVMKAGQHVKNSFHIKSNIITKLFTKTAKLLFYWLSSSVEYIFLKDRIVRDK